MASAANLDNLMLDDLTLGERIRHLREHGRHGRLSHDRLADALGTTRQTVIGWEKHGRQPNQEYRKRLANFFGVAEEVIMDGPPDRERLRDLAVRLEELEAALEELGPLLARLGDRVTALESQVPTRTGRGGHPEFE